MTELNDLEERYKEKEKELKEAKDDWEVEVLIKEIGVINTQIDEVLHK